MRSATLIFGWTVLALCSRQAGAQDPDPTVRENEWAAYDVAALKPGEWVEYEMQAAGGAIKTSYRLACVGVEGDRVSIESNQVIALDPARKDMVIHYVVDSKSRMIMKALLGKAGEAGRELRIEKSAAGSAETGAAPRITGTGKVSSEKVKIRESEFDCEKVDRDEHMEAGGLKFDTKSTTWTSEKVAFRSRVDETKAADPKSATDVKWDGKPSGKGALVKLVSTVNGTRTEINLTGWGTDAKKTLK